MKSLFFVSFFMLLACLAAFADSPSTPSGKGTHAVAMIAGDANSSGEVTGMDVVFLVNYLVKNRYQPQSLVTADANGDCRVDLVDITYLVAYFKGRGPAPHAGNCR